MAEIGLLLFARIQPDVLLLPSIKGLVGNSNPPDQLSKRNSCFCLPQGRYDLFTAEAFLSHG
jgi:hypothetical protein